jgi:leucyl-tRNA synthetase
MVSALMEFTNLLSERQRADTWRTATYHQALETLLLLMAPAAPHIADELWQRTGHAGSVHQQAWPAWDEDQVKEELAQVAIQVNGRLRWVIEAPVDASRSQIKELALAQPKVQQHLEGKAVKQVFYVPGKILNMVTE